MVAVSCQSSNEAAQSTVLTSLAWLFEYTGGGAMNDVKDSCFPSTHRDSAFTVAALHQWSHTEPPPLDTKCVVSAEEWINEVIQPNSAGGPLPCVRRDPTQEIKTAISR